MDSRLGPGRPNKARRPTNAANLKENTSTQLKNSAFGKLERTAKGEVILPAGLFEEIQEKFNKLAERKFSRSTAK